MASGAVGGALALLPHCATSRQDRYLLLHLSLLPAPSVNARLIAHANSSRKSGKLTAKGLVEGQDEQQQGACAPLGGSPNGGDGGFRGEESRDVMLPVEDMLQLARSVDRERINGMLQAIGRDSVSQVRGLLK